MEDNRTITAVLAFCILVVCVSSAWAQWDSNGERFIVNGTYPHIISNVNGEYIVVGGNTPVFGSRAQKISINGYDLWNPSGLGLNAMPQLVSDGHGGAIISGYSESPGSPIFYGITAVRINSLGNGLWGTNVYSDKEQRTPARIVSDGRGGAIVTWNDCRGISCDAVYVQRVDSNGNKLWTAGGVRVYEPTGSGSTFFARPEIISDGSSGAIVSWKHWSWAIAAFEIRAQRIDSLGNLLWGENAVSIGTVPSSESIFGIVEDGQGGAILSWAQVNPAGLFVQRIDSNGNKIWGTEGILVNNEAGDHSMISDRNGGAILAFDSGGSGNPGFYMQRVDATGALTWGQIGVRISDGGGHNCIASSGVGLGVIVVWLEGPMNLYAQKIDDSGNPQWGNHGIVVHPNIGDRYFDVVSDGLGGAIVVWQGVYARRILSNGESPVAVLLQSFFAKHNESGIEIGWRLSDESRDMNFSVLRRETGFGDFLELESSGITREGLSFNYLDETIKPGATYYYRVDVADEAGRRTLFETDAISTPALPLTLYQNHPNPFNPSTVISYYVPDECNVTLEIYDISGKRISQLVRKEQEKGFYTAEWNGLDSHGTSVSSGIYFYRLIAGKETVSKKMVLLK